MCGICGFITPEGLNADRGRARLQTMTDRLVHRGPDAEGHWLDATNGVGLGARRLAVVDTGPAGNQPLHSRSGRYVMVFNGEIYNHTVLRRQLDAHIAPTSGHSDSGVLLAAIDRWGLRGALQHCTGMFAIALWDQRQRSLWLARDRLGEKPLFYGMAGPSLLFGSELKALWVHPDWRGDMDLTALNAYFQQRFVPAPQSIFAGIHKLPPGCLVGIDPAKLADAGLPQPESYWDPVQRRLALADDPFDASETQAGDALEQALQRSVERQMLADVPVGVLLSGGIDSTAVASTMQRLTDRPIQTFTIGLRESDYDEAVHARRIAAYLGTEHTELTVTPDDALAVIPELPSIWDEPLADNSQIPTLLVARLARRQVTVALTGDGGDELFCGYRRFLQGGRLWRWLRGIPLPVRRLLGTALAHTPAAVNRLGRGGGARPLADQLRKLATAAGATDLAEFHHRLRADWPSGQTPLATAMAQTASPFGSPFEQSLDIREQMMLLDLRGWLVDDVLVKVDRAAMAASLETRAPFLDHELVELAWRMPMSVKVRDGQGKWLLRELLYRRLPRELVDRPKQGFTLPMHEWLRGPLRDWAEDLLDGPALAADGLLDARRVRKRWQEHLSGRHDWRDPLWNLLSFLAWRQAYRERQSEQAGRCD